MPQAAGMLTAHTVDGNGQNTPQIDYAIHDSHVDFSHRSLPLLRCLAASVRVITNGHAFDTQEELQRAERQLNQERLRPPAAVPGQLAEHEAAWKGTLQDAQQKLQQALADKTVGCLTSAILGNSSSSGKTWRVLFASFLKPGR